MSIRILCPNLKCRAILTVPETTRGKKVRCGHCAAVLMVPQVKKQARPNLIDEPAENGAELQE